MSDAVFAALADPTRRRIIEALGRPDGVTATALAGELTITRQAVAKHLNVLTEAGIAEPTRVGRETRFAPRPGAFDDIETWLANVEKDWANRLGRLAAAIESRPLRDR